MLWDCLDCHTKYAASLTACPHCGSPDRIADGEPAPAPPKPGKGGAG